MTHYPEIAAAIEPSETENESDNEKERELSRRAVNMHMGYLLDDSHGGADRESTRTSSSHAEGVAEQVVFLYRAVRGAARGSYGLNAARLAGMDAQLLARASEKSASLRAALQSRCRDDGGHDEDDGGEEGVGATAEELALKRQRLS